MPALLFIHGGGDDAFRFDFDVTRRLQDAIGTEFSIEYPRFEGLERIEWAPTSAELSARLLSLSPGATVVAHSAGGAATLKILSGEGDFSIRNLFLLAAPYKAEDNHWGQDEFTFSNDFAGRLDKDLNITIYHSRDDATIPVGDALLYKRKLPQATVHLLDGYGHQFTGLLDRLANDIRSVTRS